MTGPVVEESEQTATILAARRAASALFLTLVAERERWILWFPVALGLGIALYFSLPSEPPTWSGISLLLALVSLVFALRRRQGIFLIALAFTLVSAGFAAAQVRSLLVAAPVLEREIGPVEVSGRIVSIEPQRRGLRLLLDSLDIERLAPEATPLRARLTVTAKGDALIPGQRLQALAVLRPPPEPVSPGAFDFARQAYFERLGAVGFALGQVEPLEAGRGGGFAPLDGWHIFWPASRNAVAARIEAILEDDVGAVAVALTTGQRGTISEETLAQIRDSGLAHLLAISGLHIGLVTAIVFFTLRFALAAWPRVALYYPIKKWAALAAAIVAFFYLLLSGATFPTQRACLMTLVVLLAVWIDRTAISLRLVAFAAAVILLLHPEALLSASFQLSFAAVTALISAYEWRRLAPMSERIGRRSWPERVGLYLLAVLATSLIATLATTPFAIQHFNRFAWLGIVANLLAVPLTAFWIMPWGVAAFLLMPLGLEALALVPMGWGIEAMLAVAEWVAGWPGAVILLPAMPGFGFALTTLGGLWLCLWQQPWRLAGLVALILGLSTMSLDRPPDVLVGGEGKLMAVRDSENALWLSSQRRATFTAGIWEHRLAASRLETWPDLGGDPRNSLACDPQACVLERHGVTIALVSDPLVLAEECRRAQVIVSLEPLRRLPCPSARRVIDRFDLWREGAHAIRVDTEGKIEIRSVRAARGERPWVQQRGW